MSMFWLRVLSLDEHDILVNFVACVWFLLNSPLPRFESARHPAQSQSPSLVTRRLQHSDVRSFFGARLLGCASLFALSAASHAARGSSTSISPAAIARAARRREGAGGEARGRGRQDRQESALRRGAVEVAPQVAEQGAAISQPSAAIS